MEEILLRFSDQSDANAEQKYSSEVQDCLLKGNCPKFYNILKKVVGNID